MLGQGMGTIEDFELRSRCKQVLPLVDLIAVREKVFAPERRMSFGVSPSRIELTGDDAIELAYQARCSSLGTDIG